MPPLPYFTCPLPLGSMITPFEAGKKFGENWCQEDSTSIHQISIHRRERHTISFKILA
jgi:hypothetical protein